MLTNPTPQPPRPDLLLRLKPKQRTGSKARCHLLTHGPRDSVAASLTSVALGHALVTPNDSWMPEGFEALEEARLGTATKLIPDSAKRSALSNWWLAVSAGANTPNWDIASTCIIHGRPGLLLIEAKAHFGELEEASAGKALEPPFTVGSKRNHVRVGACIHEACLVLASETRLPWSLSRDWNYQMSNRFAWSWKLTELGIPVVLIYLGMLNANEMRLVEKSRKPFPDAAAWEALVRAHSQTMIPADIWNHSWVLHGQNFTPLIKAIEQPLS